MTEGTPRNPVIEPRPNVIDAPAGQGAHVAEELGGPAMAVFGLSLPGAPPRAPGREVFPPPVDDFGQGAQDARAKSYVKDESAERTQALDPAGAPPYAPRPLDLASLAARRDLPPPPQRVLGVSLWDATWFALSFIIPLVISSIYYFFIASNQYVVDVRYTVRTPDTAATVTPGANAMALLGGGQVGTVDQNNAFVLDDYTKSSQAARDLNSRLDLRKIYTRRGVDFLSRIKNNASDEELAAFWKKMSYSLTDPATGLSVLKVRAFTPDDAYEIANTMIALYGVTVNNLGRHSRADSLKFAQEDVERQRKTLTDLTDQMTSLRNANNVVDPMTNTVASNINVASGLRAAASQTQAQITALTEQLHNPNAPQLAPLRAQLAATRQQLRAVEEQINRAQGADPSLSNVVGKFEKLTALRTTAATALSTAVANLQSAQTNDDSQRIYVDAYVRPAKPDTSTYPNRLQAVCIAALICLLIWVVGLLLAHSLIDHT